MAYSTLTDLIERAGEEEILQIADRDNDGTADPAVIAAAIALADQTIDAFLSARYVLPLAPAPVIVAKWSIAIARYNLHRDGAPDYVVRDYKDAMAELRDAGAGRLMIPDASGIQPAPTAVGGVTAGASPSVFTDESLEGFR